MIAVKLLGIIPTFEGSIPYFHYHKGSTCWIFPCTQN